MATPPLEAKARAHLQVVVDLAVEHQGDPAAVAGDGLGHTRLAILDLTAAGAQPITSHGGRITLVFNGEIYNHLEVRAGLRFQGWRG
ncbi:MAG: hypothetical protein ACK41W_04430, partial [Cyanobacteriota bacterium]